MRAAILSVVVAASACVEDELRDGGVRTDAGAAECLKLPDEIDFGETPVGIDVERTVLLTNPAAAGSVLTSSISGLPFSMSLPPQQFLGPRQSMLVAVRFNAPDGRLHVGTLTFTGGAGCPIQEVALRGLGAGSLKLETPSPLEFGFAPLGVTQTRMVRLVNTRRANVKLTVTVPAAYRVSGPMVVPALGSLDVPISVTPLAGDVLNGSIFIIGSHMSVNGTPIIGDSLDLPVRGRAGVPRIVVERTSIELEHLPLAGALQRRIGIRNDGDGETNLSVTLQSDGGSPISTFSLDTSLLPPGERATLVIALRAPFSGPVAATFVVRSEFADAGSTLISISGRGENRPGCAQQLQVTPQDVSLTSPTYPVSLTFTFTNPTMGACLVDDIYGSVPEWTLSPGESDQMIVPAQGTATRTLILNGPGSGSFWWTTFTHGFVEVQQFTSISALP